MFVLPVEASQFKLYHYPQFLSFSPGKPNTQEAHFTFHLVLLLHQLHLVDLQIPQRQNQEDFSPPIHCAVVHSSQKLALVQFCCHCFQGYPHKPCSPADKSHDASLGQKKKAHVYLAHSKCLFTYKGSSVGCFSQKLPTVIWSDMIKTLTCVEGAVEGRECLKPNRKASCYIVIVIKIHYFRELPLLLRPPTLKGSVSQRPSRLPHGYSGGRACRGSAAREKGSIVLGAGSGGSCTCRGGEAAPCPAETTPGALGESLPSISSALRARREEPALPRSGRERRHHHPRGTSRPAAPRLTGHGEKAASGLFKAIRGLPAFSPPGFPQRSSSHRPRPSFTKWRLLFVCRHRAPPLPSALPGTETAGAASPPPSEVKILTDAKREGARREPALNS